MNTKENGLNRTATEFTDALCMLAREYLVGIVTERTENGFTFSLPGAANVFHVCVTAEKPEDSVKK